MGEQQQMSDPPMDNPAQGHVALLVIRTWVRQKTMSAKKSRKKAAWMFLKFIKVGRSRSFFWQ